MRKTVSLALTFVCLCLFSAFSAWQGYRADGWKRRVEEMHRGTLLSALTQMESMQYALQKAMLSQDANAGDYYLSHVSEGAGQVQRSLSLLPLSHPDTMQAIKLTNQLSAYARTLMEQESLSPSDTAQLSALIDTCRACTRSLMAQQETLTLSSSLPPFYPEGQTEAFDSAVSYPTLIYDGPFSDARQDREPNLSAQQEITWEEAARIARSCIGENRVLSVSPGAALQGPTPCHGVTLHLQDITLEAAVTRQGGKMLWITPDNGAFPCLVTIEECKKAALLFLERNGYGPMESTYFQVYEGMAVVSFAPVQGDVLLYPDLIKVQLRMDTAEVVGMEAKNYLIHHRARSALRPSLTQGQALEKVSPLLQVSGSRLCLIPKDEEEILCYEFSCTWQDAQFLLYINAFSGAQEELLQVVESATGLETV